LRRQSSLKNKPGLPSKLQGRAARQGDGSVAVGQLMLDKQFKDFLNIFVFSDTH
jgi:hypothetical protein